MVRADSTVGSPLLKLGPSEVILADCKDYEEDGHVFSVAQIVDPEILAFLREAEGIFRVGGLSVKAGELFRWAFSHRCKNTQNSLNMKCLLRIIFYALCV